MWNWLVENCLAAEISACVDSLYQFFRVRSLFREGMQWFEQGVNSLQGEPASELALGMLLSRLGALAHLARENDQALDALLRSQEIFQQHSMLSELAYCRIHLGWVYQREKDFATALEFGGQSLAYYHSVSDALGELQAFSLLGSIRKRQGSNREARQLFDQALHLCRQAGNPRQLVTILNRLGDLACYEGQYETAVGQFLECLEISKGLNDRFNQAILLNNLGTIYHVWKDYLRALDYYQKSLDICREIGDQDGIALALNNLGELALVQGDRLSAIQYSENALQIAEKLQEKWTVIVCLNCLGEIYCGMGVLDKSKHYFMRAIRLAVAINGMDLVARVSVNTARTIQLLGDCASATALLQAALAHPSTEHEAREKAVCWLDEMNAESAVALNEARLGEEVEKLLLAATPHPENRS